MRSILSPIRTYIFSRDCQFAKNCFHLPALDRAKTLRCSSAEDEMSFHLIPRGPLPRSSIHRPLNPKKWTPWINSGRGGT